VPRGAAARQSLELCVGDAPRSETQRSAETALERRETLETFARQRYISVRSEIVQILLVQIWTQSGLQETWVIGENGVSACLENLSAWASPDLASTVHRIAVVRPNHRLGNAVLLTPFVRALESRFPASRIELITTGSAAQSVFQQFPRVTAVHSFPARSFRDPLGVSQMLLALKFRSYDLAIDPIMRARGGRFILGWLRSRERVGFRWNSSSRDRMLTHAVEPTGSPKHFAETPLFLLQDGRRSEAASIRNRRLDLRLTAAERCAGVRRLGSVIGSGTRPCIGVFANATGDKCFPPEWWRRVLLAMRRKAPGMAVVEFVPADRRPRLGGDIPALFTPDLRLLAATMSATTVLLSGDCGVMHLADAGAARVVGLFRTSDPSRYGPSGPGSTALWAKDQCADELGQRLRGVLGSP
jgi:ADP-heptose:LPS heptosyltransferase